jgi:hypothetical protein
VKRKAAFLAWLLAAAALAGCHGATITEADGGSAGSRAGAGGSGGDGGTAGAAGGAGHGGVTGTAGGGCAAQMQPVMFHQSMSAPLASGGTSNRYYWVEFVDALNSTGLTVHYSPGAAPASETTHPLHVDGPISTISFDFSDALVAATWGADGQTALYGPDRDSTQIAATSLGNISDLSLDGTTVFLSYYPISGSPMPGIYTWSPPAMPVIFESDTDLGGLGPFAPLVRAMPTRLLVSDAVTVHMIDRSLGGMGQSLFKNLTGRTLLDVRPARPRSIEQGVLVDLDDANFFGRDYYVDVSQPNAKPTDLSMATLALAEPSACGAAAAYSGAGVLYRGRYVYEGQAGLFAVDVSPAGAVSNLVRLTNLTLAYPEVTGAGDLFAVTRSSAGAVWDYYRVGNI